MKKNIYLLLAVFLSDICNAQEDIVTNFKKADSIVDSVLKKYDFINKPIYSALYAGERYFSGHFSVPNMLDTSAVNCEIKYDTEQTFVNTDMEYNGKKYFAQQIFYNDSCLLKGYGDTIFSSKKYYNGLMEYFFNPLNVISEITKHKNTLHFLSTNDNCCIVGYNDLMGCKYFVYINKDDFTISQIVKYYNDWNYGDSFDKVIYKNESYSTTVIPSDIKYYKGKNINKHISLTSVSSINYIENKTLSNNEIFETDTITNNCFLVKILTRDNKVLVYKQGANISVFEAPINPIISNRLIGYLNKYFNNAPVKYCFLTHHHPDHAGGIKSFKEIESTVVAPAEDADYIGRLANYPFIINGIYDKFFSVKFDVVRKDSTKYFIDGKVIAYEVGRETAHTENFILYYLPEEKILFSSDLLFLPKSKIFDQGKRAYSVYNVIAKNHIPTAELKIIPSWPLKNSEDYGTFYDLIDCLRKNYPELDNRYPKRK